MKRFSVEAAQPYRDRQLAGIQKLARDYASFRPATMCYDDGVHNFGLSVYVSPRKQKTYHVRGTYNDLAMMQVDANHGYVQCRSASYRKTEFNHLTIDGKPYKSPLASIYTDNGAIVLPEEAIDIESVYRDTLRRTQAQYDNAERIFKLVESQVDASQGQKVTIDEMNRMNDLYQEAVSLVYDYDQYSRSMDSAVQNVISSMEAKKHNRMVAQSIIRDAGATVRKDYLASIDNAMAGRDSRVLDYLRVLGD